MSSVPLNYRLIAADYESILDDCGARLAVADYEYAEKVGTIRDQVPPEMFVANPADRVDGDWRDYESLLAAADPDAVGRPAISEDDPATINYTSGTTGDPKGVVQTHRTEHWHALTATHHAEISDDDTSLWTLPMFHLNGWGYPYIITGVGGTHVCQRHFDARGAFDRIHAHDALPLWRADGAGPHDRPVPVERYRGDW